jgi:hypothetical protein
MSNSPTSSDGFVTPTLEELLELLSSSCDGSKKRDGVGFNKGDAQDGARLAAMAKKGISWSEEDFKRAQELVQRYASQAARGWTSSKLDAQKLERAIRGGCLGTKRPPEGRESEFNYAAISSGAKNVYVYFMVWAEELKGAIEEIKALRTLKHGERTVTVEFEKSVVITVNGKKKRLKRWVIDLNGTTQPYIIDIADRYGMVIDPGVTAPIDPQIDRLTRSARALWITESVRNGQMGKWFVFDLHRKDNAFKDAMRALLPGKYECDPSDDWNWFVPVTRQTAPLVAQIAKQFKFTCHPIVEAVFRKVGAA